MKKFTAKDVGEQIDFSDGPHGNVPISWQYERACACDRCVSALSTIAESLSMDGTEVKGVFTVDEKKAIERRVAGYIEEDLFGVR